MQREHVQRMAIAHTIVKATLVFMDRNRESCQRHDDNISVLILLPRMVN